MTQEALVDQLTRLLEPSSDFIKLAVKPFETRDLVDSVIEEWKPKLENAIAEWARQQTLVDVSTDDDDGEPGQLSAIDAAAKVLGEASQPMNCKELIEVMATKGYWTSPTGKTPWATLYAAILKEMKKGKESRFTKVGPNLFARLGRWSLKLMIRPLPKQTRPRRQRALSPARCLPASTKAKPTKLRCSPKVSSTKAKSTNSSLP